MPYKLNPFTGEFDFSAATGDKVSGPASSTDDAVVRWNGTTGRLVQNSGVIIDDDDLVTIPSGSSAGIAFGDGDTKIYEDSDDVIFIDIAGSNIFQFDATDLKGAATGNVLIDFTTVDAAPAYSFVNDDDTGMYRSAANTLNFQTGGMDALTISNAQVVSLTNALPVASGGTGQTTYTDGQLLIGNSTGNTLAKATLTAGTGITITNGSGSIQIDSTGGGLTWNEETGTSATIVVQNGYIANNAGLVTFTLPATAALGDKFSIVGKGAGLFSIAQNAGQTIHIVGSSTTTGAGGSLTAIEQFAAIEVICTTANTDFTVVDMTGNYTVV